MANTTYMNWVYPDEGERPYYDKISNFFGQIDRETCIGIERDQYIVFGGGAITFDSNTGVLSWTSPIYFLNITTGYMYTVNEGSVIISNGQYVYIQIEPGLTENKVVTVSTGNQPIGLDNTKILLGIRIDNNFYKRPFYTAV